MLLNDYCINSNKFHIPEMKETRETSKLVAPQQHLSVIHKNDLKITSTANSPVPCGLQGVAQPLFPAGSGLGIIVSRA